MFIDEFTAEGTPEQIETLNAVYVAFRSTWGHS
jgi:hypothetical protein